MRHLLRSAILASIAFCFVPALHAQFLPYENFCQYGGQKVITQGLQSTTYVQASYPQCTVTVYQTGTLTLATIFSTSGGGALSNPFTAATNASFIFFASSAICYDVTISGGTPNAMPGPYTFTGQCLGTGSGGTGTVTNFSATNNATGLLTLGVTSPSTTPNLTVGLPSNSPANQVWGNCTGAPATSAYCALTAPMLPFTYSGNTTELGTVTGGTTSGHCVQWDASGNLVDSGGVCGGSGNVTTLPGAGVSQNIKQLPTTEFGATNIERVYYADQYNWTQSPSGSLSAGIAASVSISTDATGFTPRGIDTTNGFSFGYYLYVAGTGTPEIVKITGGTCPVGGQNSACTVNFTPTNSHAAGFTIQSATAGWTEAQNDACGLFVGGSGCGFIKISGTPAIMKGAGIRSPQYQAKMFAPFHVRCVFCVIGGNAELFEVMTATNRQAAIVPDGGQKISIENVSFVTDLGSPLTGSAITQTACSANVATLQGTNTFAVGDSIDVMLTNNQFYWGLHTITAATGSQFSFALSCGSVAAESTAGLASWELAWIEDNSQGTTIRNPSGYTLSGSPGFNNSIIVRGADQAAFIYGMQSPSADCSGATNYCGSGVYAPEFPAIVRIEHSDLSMQCQGNGVTFYGGNTLSVTDTVIQGYNMWGINGGPRRGGLQGGQVIAGYEEVGGCTNPFYPGSFAGVIWISTRFLSVGGTMSEGKIPVYTTGGGTTYYYYLVTHTTGGPAGTTQSGPLYIGAAAPSGTTVNVTFPRVVDDSVGVSTTTYDIIRSTDPSNAPTTSACTGGSTSACGSVTLAMAQCSGTLQCTFADNVSVNTTSYTVPTPGLPANGAGSNTGYYVPLFNYFYGDWVLMAGAHLTCLSGNCFNLNRDGAVSAMNGYGPVVTDTVLSNKTRTYARIQSINTTEMGSNMSQIIYAPNGAGVGSPPIGALLFIGGMQNGCCAGVVYGSEDVITLATPNSQGIMAANAQRITANANDTGIGFDNGATSNANNLSMQLRAPVAISRYIASLADGTSWKERLTSSLETYNVPVQAPSVATNGLFGELANYQEAVCETSGGITTLNVGGTTTDTGQNCLPATAVIDAVVYRITTTITTAANFTIGDATTAARFCATQSTLTAGTTGTCFVQADQTGAAGPRQTAAAKVRVTTNVNPGAGAIRMMVFYHTWSPPTS